MSELGSLVKEDPADRMEAEIVRAKSELSNYERSTKSTSFSLFRRPKTDNKITAGKISDRSQPERNQIAWLVFYKTIRLLEPGSLYRHLSAPSKTSHPLQNLWIRPSVVQVLSHL